MRTPVGLHLDHQLVRCHAALIRALLLREMTARKSKSTSRKKGGATLKLRRGGRGKEEDEEVEMESSEGDCSLVSVVGRGKCTS